MKLLLDENLSHRIVREIELIFPGSAHVKDHNLITASDLDIWEFAKRNSFTLVSKDSDFHQRSLVLGAPPKFVYLRVGNCPTERVVSLLNARAEVIEAFLQDKDASVLVLP
ncbi:MAG: DUF5615 family PIN-like protein [Chthoniobacterales bacterium]